MAAIFFRSIRAQLDISYDPDIQDYIQSLGQTLLVGKGRFLRGLVYRRYARQLLGESVKILVRLRHNSDWLVVVFQKTQACYVGQNERVPVFLTQIYLE
jgi:hypothetical protein